MRLRSLVLLAFCFVWPIVRLQAQDEAKALVDEEDARVTGLAARQNAVTTLLTAGNQLRDAGEELKAARALNRAGRFQLELNQPDQAIATYRSALKVLRQTSDPQTRIDTLNGLAGVYKHTSKCAEAKPLLRRAISLSDQNAYGEGKAEAFMVLSYCESDMSLALKNAQKSLQLWQSTNRKLGTAQAYLAVGEFQMIQNSLIESAQSYQSALALWRELNVPRQIAEALINLGFIEYRKGAWQTSLSFYTQAQPLIDEEAEPYMMGQIKAGLAETFIESGLLETGLDRYRESLEYFHLTKMPITEIGIKWCIGRVHYLEGNYSEALAMLNTTRAEANSIDYVMVAALSDDFLGRTYYAMNDYAAALQRYQAALDGFTRSGNPMEAARIVALMGQVYQQQGNFEKAKQHYQRALARFEELSDEVNESATLYALGTLELKQNDVDAAKDYLHKSMEITEKMRRFSTSVDLTAAFSARVHERYEKYIDCLMRQRQALQSESLAIEAFETSELERARSLTELLWATRANLFPGLDPQIVQQEKKLREFLQMNENAKVTLLSRKSYKTAELEVLEAEHERLKVEHDRLIEDIRARSPAYEQTIRPTAWKLSRIQEQVIPDDQTVLLEYSLGSEKSYLWTITRSGIKSYELPGEEQIVEVAKRVYDLLKTAPEANADKELAAAAQELAKIILWPAAEELNKGRIIVVPDGILNYIPFQILPSPRNNELLVANSEIINTPSASILGELQHEAAQRQPATNLLAAFGDPIFAPTFAQAKNAKEPQIATARLRSALRDMKVNTDGFDLTAVTRLFYAKRELESLREVAGEKTLIVSDYAATREQFLSTDLTQYSMLHLVTHGYFDPKRPEVSGLLLSTVNREEKPLNGFVGLQDIYELRAPVLLVVLSACQTALGKDVRGEGLLGVTRGFMYAGASSVVASLWQVDDAATAELMKLFYSNMLQRGMKPGEALRAAQNSIRQRPEWRSPYYWAAFTLQGEYSRVIRPEPHAARSAYSLKILLAVGLLMLASAALWYGYRSRHVRVN
jgi:CHAT domain-containing protein